MTLKLSPLNDVHVTLGGRMIDFGGWSLPVQYSGIIEEHVNTRTHVSLFDISHMGEFMITGKLALNFLQYVCVNDVSLMKQGSAQYSTICNEKGGIIDDLFYYMYSNEKYKMIVNASNKDKDFAWLKKQSSKFKGVTISDESSKRSRIALQGPKAQDVLQSLVEQDLDSLKRFQFVEASIGSVPSFIARTGYTGEDGFEISFPVDQAVDAWNAIMTTGEQFGIKPAGLGARDTLRLEACYSLYGNELNETITPVEAGIEFIIKQSKQMDYIGREMVLEQMENGAFRTIVALKVLDKGILRHGQDVFDESTAEKIGTITSGTFSPTLKEGIALALVNNSCSAIGTIVTVKVREKVVRATIVQKPFYAYHPRS
jgi:aminomethyltransferase